MNNRGTRMADWVRRWNSGLTRFIEKRVPVSADAQDLAQEVYLRLLRAEEIDHIVEPRAYLYRVASNVASEWRLRWSQSRPHSAEELEGLVESATPELLVDAQLDRAMLQAALGKLDPMLRAVLFLRLRDGMNHEDIGRHLGITPRMARRYVSTGYAELRKGLLHGRAT